MQSKVLYRFPVQMQGEAMPRAWQWLESQNMLAIICGTDDDRFTLFLLDMQTAMVHTPGSWPFDKGAETLHAICMEPPGHWMVGSLSNDVVVCRVVFDEVKQEVVVRVLLDDPCNDNAGIGPFYAFWKEQEKGVVIYMKPESDHMGSSSICLSQIDFFSEGAEPITLEKAYSAMACVHASKALLLTLNALKFDIWGFGLSCYDSSSFACSWQRKLDLSFAGPTFDLEAKSDLEWKGINATILPGLLSQQEDQQTWLVGVTMVDIFQDTGFGHSSAGASLIRKRASLLTWLDVAGQELWRCSDEVGLRLQLCQIGPVVAGVDLLDGRWRLWVWHPQQNTALQNVTRLDQNILRAHILAGKNGESKHFWLIEESQEGIKVSQYEMSSLYEAVSTVWLPGTHLLEPQNGCRSLNWHEEIDAFVVEDKLLLFCIDEEQRLVICQTE